MKFLRSLAALLCLFQCLSAPVAEAAASLPPSKPTFLQATGLVADAQTVTGPVTGSYAYSNSASIAGTVLTTSGSPNAGNLGGTFAIGQTLFRNGVSLGVTIVSLGTGTGAAGTYNLSAAPGDVSGVAITASSPTFIVTNAAFTAADVGKGIRLEGWGTNYNDLITTIAAVNSPTSITLAAPPTSIPFIGRGGNFFQGISYGTDNSVAIKAAHDAAFAAGRRFVQLPAGQYWVGNLLYAGNALFIGEGAKFVGSTLFRVFSPFQRGAYKIRPGITPAAHLARWAASTTKRIAVIGDSIKTSNFIGNSGVYETQEIKKEFLRSYAGLPSNFLFNFSIGGTALSDLASTSEINFSGRGLSVPYWHTAGNSWLTDILNYAWGSGNPPDLFIIALGVNTPGALNAELAAVNIIVTRIKAAAPNADIIFDTPGVGSLQSSTWYGTGPQKEAVASYIRGYAQRNGYGLLDIGRHTRLLRDGFDPISNDIPLVPLTNFGGSRNFPVVLPQTRDFLYNWNMPASNVTSNITSSNPLNIVIGDTINPAYTTIFQITATAGGNFAISLVQTGVGTILGPVDTGVPIPTTGTVYFEFSVRDNHIEFAAATTNYGAAGIMPRAWVGEVERCGGLFSPRIYFGNYVSTNHFPTQLDISVENLVLPTLTDNEYFGPGGTVHPTSGAQVILLRQALENERLR